MTLSKSLSLLAIAFGLSQLHGCNATSEQVEAAKLSIWQPVNSPIAQDDEIEAKITDMLSKMTIRQKVAQMIQPEIRDITVEDMRQHGFGSFLNGGGAFPNNDKHSTPEDWIALAEAMYQASIDDSIDGSTIPTMWGTDAVHGHNNVIGATLFPHNIGLGAANNPELIEKIAQVTATEVMVTGIDWVFAPTVATVRDDRWGRTYEGYSEDPEIVKAYAAAIVTGLQGKAGEDFLADNRVISTVKHFIGDGGTVDGDDQGDNIDNEQELYDIHAQGYVGGLGAGSQSVMASFNSWHGKKNHGNRYLLTDVLKHQMGFDGFVVGDWNGHGQIKGCTNESCPQAINAGLDIFMVPTGAWQPLLENTINQVKQGVISIARIDDAVRRILRVKFRANLFNKPSPKDRVFSGKTELIGAVEHRQLARQAVRESLVLLKNQQQLLPLSPKMNILVAGDAADNIGKQSGGWTITWQGTNNKNTDFPGATSIYAGLAKQVKAAGGNIHFNENGEFTQKPDVAIVVFGEEPYAEGVGDRAHLAYQAEEQRDLALLKKLKAQDIPTVAVFITGRPMWVNAELNASDAFVVAWLPGTEGEGIADVLLKNIDDKVQYDFTGRLSFSWPKTPTQIVNRFDQDYQPLFPYGYGLSVNDKHNVTQLSETSELSSTQNDKTLAVFNGGLQSPWQMSIFSASKVQTISASSHQLNKLSYRTIDNKVQEDSFRLSSSGAATSGVRFNVAAEKSSGIELALANKNIVKLTIKMPKSRPDNLNLGFGCDQHMANCASVYNVSKQLNSIALNQWQTVEIPASCFSDILGKKALRASVSLFSSLAYDIDIHQLSFEQADVQTAAVCH